MTPSPLRWLFASALITCVATACGPSTQPGNDSGGTDTALADTGGGDTNPADTTGRDVVGTDAQGTDVVGTDVQGTDVVGTDVVGTDVQGTDVVGTDVVVKDTGVDVVIGTDVQGTDVVTKDVGIDDVVIGTDVQGTDVVTTDVGIDVPAVDVGVDVAMDVPVGLCNGAVNLNTAGTVSGATTTYTGSNAAAPAAAVVTPSCRTNQGSQVVHSYTSATRSALLVSAVDPGTTYDTVIVALNGCLATGAEVGCNDDFSGLQSQFTTAVFPAGTTFLILVGGYGATPATGTYVLHITELAEIPVGGTCDPTGATNICVPASSCATVGTTTTCVADGSLGGVCRATGTACDAPNVCNAAGDTCVAVIPDGGACDPAGNQNVCTTADHCITAGTTSTCIADGSLGGRCNATGTACTAPNACNGPPAGAASLCVPVIAAGGACDPARVANVCGTGYICTTVGTTSTCTLLPYTETSIAVSCADLSTVGVAVPGVTGDDGASALIALPIPFTYFGTAMDHYSATTNGFMQLWVGTTGTPSTAYTNAALPTATEPSNILSVFWDDLSVVAPAVVRTATLGSAPNRTFVVEWNNVTHLAAGNTWQFQVQLYETSNIIEFHYCSMLPTTDTNSSGASATIGIGNANGTIANQHSFNTAGSITAPTAIRYHP